MTAEDLIDEQLHDIELLGKEIDLLRQNKRELAAEIHYLKEQRYELRQACRGIRDVWDDETSGDAILAERLRLPMAYITAALHNTRPEIDAIAAEQFSRAALGIE